MMPTISAASTPSRRAMTSVGIICCVEKSALGDPNKGCQTTTPRNSGPMGLKAVYIFALSPVGGQGSQGSGHWAMPRVSFSASGGPQVPGS